MERKAKLLGWVMCLVLGVWIVTLSSSEQLLEETHLTCSQESIARNSVCGTRSRRWRSLLPLHANDAGAEPHHEFGPGRMGLLLCIVCSRVGAARLLQAKSRLRENASGCTTLMVTLHGEIRLGALGTRWVAGGGLAVGALNLESLLLVTLFTLADLLTGGFLILGLLFLLESAAGFLDGHGAVTGVNFTA